MKDKGRTEDDAETWATNRDKKRAPRQGIFWCACDFNMIAAQSKCSVCGRKNIKVRRNKK